MRYYTSPLTYQRGAGLGNILSKAFRTILPLFKKPIVQRGLKRVGSALLNTGVAGLSDHLETKTPLKQSLKRQALRESKQLLKSIAPPAKKQQPPPPRRLSSGEETSRRYQKQGKRRRGEAGGVVRRKLDIFDFE